MDQQQTRNVVLDIKTDQAFAPPATLPRRRRLGARLRDLALMMCAGAATCTEYPWDYAGYAELYRIREAEAAADGHGVRSAGVASAA